MKNRIKCLLIWIRVEMVLADYQCICKDHNTNVVDVYGTATTKTLPIGLLENGHCKQYLYPTSKDANAFYAIMYKHQIGFVSETDVTLGRCEGTPSTTDVLTTASPAYTKSLATMNTRKRHTTIKATITSKSTPSFTTSLDTSTLTTVRPLFTIKLPVTSRNPSTISSLTVSSQSAPTLFSTSIKSTSNAFTAIGKFVCPLNIQKAALSARSLTFINDNNGKCYEFVKFKRTWSFAEDDCQRKGGHLTSIENSIEEKLLFGYVQTYGSRAWIGLNDRNSEENFEWSSGDALVYQNWQVGRKDPTKHSTEDCVTIGANTGFWEDERCNNYHAYICKFDAVVNNGTHINQLTTHSYNTASTLPTTTVGLLSTTGKNDALTSNQGSLPSVDGNTQLCSSTVRHLAERDNAILGQYERGCYELMRSADVSWQHGEDMCQSRGGHLAHISNAQQQAFIQTFLHRHSPQHAVWIGLHDTHIEGAFEWTAGTSVSYTNWIPGHTSNFVSFRTEDCVAFIPYKNGKWDDIPCGNNYDLGETHPILCQYKTPITPGIVG